MRELLWYIYQDSQQTGPFALAQIHEMLDKHMIAQNAYLYKAGWKDWRSLPDCLSDDELDGKGLCLPSDTKPEAKRSAYVNRAPRATIKGRIIVHNNGQLVIGSGVNISASGIFVETPDKLFRPGEILKLTCKVEGMKKAFNVIASVTRLNHDPCSPAGYGMRFEGLDKDLAKGIQKLIDQHHSPLHNRQSPKKTEQTDAGISEGENRESRN